MANTSNQATPQPSAQRVVDVDRVLSDIPDLSATQAIATNGPFAGKTYKIASDGKWSIEGVLFDGDVSAISRDDVELVSEIGTFILRRPIVTQWNIEPGVIKGVTVLITLRPHDAPPQGKKTFRTYVRMARTRLSQISFPKTYSYPRGGGTRSLLPLASETLKLDIYALEDDQRLVFESSRIGLSRDGFDCLSNSARQLFSYLMGVSCDGDFCDLTLDHSTGKVLEVRWCPGRTLEDPPYHPLPATTRECWTCAEFLSQPEHSIWRLDPALLAGCLARLVENPSLVVPLEYLILFAHQPIELRGVILSASLESLTSYMQKQGLVRQAAKPVLDEDWPALLGGLEATLNTTAALWSQEGREESRRIIAARLKNLNSPTNREKLLGPFNALGILLKDSEVEAIEKRNDYLHRGRLLRAEDVAVDPDAWRGAYEVEMRLYTAINKVLLKYLGYTGPIIDWGSMPYDRSDKLEFELI